MVTSRRKKTHSKSKITVLHLKKITLYHILLVAEGLGKYIIMITPKNIFVSNQYLIKSQEDEVMLLS